MPGKSSQGYAEGAEVGKGAFFWGREGEAGAEFGGKGSDVTVETGGIVGQIADALGWGAAGGASGKGAGGEVEFLDEDAGEGGLGAAGREEVGDLAAQ